MKKTIILFAIVVTVLSCNIGIDKPDNLISEEKMIDIIYDLSLLEGIRSSNYNSFRDRGINPSKYIYTKYKIDSLQFVKSDRYYASDIEVYAKIYDKVAERIENQKKQIDSSAKFKPTPPKPKSPVNANRDSVLARKRELLKKLNSQIGNNPK